MELCADAAQSGRRDDTAATRWVVLTGGPCSGKTTVLNHLEGLGHAVVPEMARRQIEEHLSAGRAVVSFRGTPDLESSFQDTVLDRKIKVEQELDVNATVFMDRALPDSLAYLQHSGAASPELLAKARVSCRHGKRYKAVLLLEAIDPASIEADGARTESPAEARDLERRLHQCYTDLGYTVVVVPAGPVPDRAEIVLRAARGGEGS